ncbi:hypothetical protein BDN72DRAFT_900729 [Pluteus cervinus]|uniref:Uncharacterized protein n=1 Tax=Pluteus cervinus TaxID=181527 RepID=A0ACD3AI17_9AGAR|nr:hypothetical protein BDN72DRAFT_900729 [Pluteus cervinus]
MSGIPAISVLRLHLGLVNEEEKWAYFRASVTKVVNDTMDTSRTALPPALQVDNLDKAMEQVFRRHAQYFPRSSRDDDGRQLRRYILERFHGIRRLSTIQVAKQQKKTRKSQRQPQSRQAKPSGPNVDNRQAPTLVIPPRQRNDNAQGRYKKAAPNPPATRNRNQHQLPADDLLNFLTQECDLPLPQLYPYLKDRGHTMQNILAMSKMEFELIQATLRQLASESLATSSNNRSGPGSTSCGGGLSGGPGLRIANRDGEVTLAQWDLLAAYIYRLGH